MSMKFDPLIIRIPDYYELTSSCSSLADTHKTPGIQTETKLHVFPSEI